MSYIILRGCWCNIIVLNVHAPCEDKSDDVKDSVYWELGCVCVFYQLPRYDMNILLEDSSAKVGMEDIFKLTIGDESSHEISNGNAVRIVNFALSIKLAVKSTMFPHRSIHKYTWTSSDVNRQKQIDQISVDRIQHSIILDLRSFREADCDSDHYLVVAKVREKLAVSKRMVKKMDMERFNLKNLNEEEVKEQYQFTIKNKCVGLENLDDNGDINIAWHTIRENIKISAIQGIGESKYQKYQNRGLMRNV
jgi:hypothetical protein